MYWCPFCSLVAISSLFQGFGGPPLKPSKRLEIATRDQERHQYIFLCLLSTELVLEDSFLAVFYIFLNYLDNSFITGDLI